MDRQIEILEHKIAECDRLIVNYLYYNLSAKKVDKLQAKRDKYQTQLDELQA